MWVMDFLKTLLFEGREEFIAQQMGDKLTMAAGRDPSYPKDPNRTPLQVVQALTQADPTPNKQCIQWIVRMYLARQIKMEDLPKVQQDLTLFMKNKSKIQNRDLNSYKTLHDLYTTVQPFQGVDPELSKRQEKKQMKEEGAEYVVNTPNFKIVHLTTGKAAQFYASNTRWCTSNESTFEHYAKEGKIFVIMAKDQEGTTHKFQLHYETGQMMNAEDSPISKKEVAFLSSFPEWGE